MNQPTTNVLAAKDVNTSMANINNNANAGANGTVTKPNIKSMEYHRQMLQSKMEEEKYEFTKTTNGATTGTTAAASYRVHQLKHLPADPGAVPFGDNRMKPHYTSPSDNIMSPCTAKLNSLKSRQASKSKPKSLFAEASAKKFIDDNVFGAKNVPKKAGPPAPQGDLSDN
ncbi:hypothetical protein F5X99DRAFT_384428 [Biscogniauxia marginata]|nr:hypothetical protein F5X99DRAFT_384428 [Biscogniauxia marginata]